MEWRPVVGHEGIYEVSESGDLRRVKAASGATVGRILKPRVSHHGYKTVILRKGGKPQTRAVHRLVATAFLGRPRKGQEVCHNDGDPSNNHWRNLRWDTHRANQFDLVRHGRHLHARKTECKNGHAFDQENTYIHPTNGRVCRTCTREAQARLIARKAAHPD